MKMAQKGSPPNSSSSSSSSSSWPMNFFGGQGYKNLTCSEAVMGEGGHFPKKEFSRILKTHFGNFWNVCIVHPSLDDRSMRIRTSLKPWLGTTRHHQVRWGSELDPCSFPRVLSGKASKEGSDAERGVATEGHQVLGLGHMCDPPPPLHNNIY